MQKNDRLMLFFLYKRQFIAGLARQNHYFRSMLNKYIEIILPIQVGDEAKHRVRQM